MPPVKYWELSFDDEFKILRRICVRARTYFFKTKNSYGLDWVDHTENQIEQLSLRVHREINNG